MGGACVDLLVQGGKKAMGIIAVQIVWQEKPQPSGFGKALVVKPGAGDRAGPIDAVGIGSQGMHALQPVQGVQQTQQKLGDRKSTRLNSSHVAISYAVF